MAEEKDTDREPEPDPKPVKPADASGDADRPLTHLPLGSVIRHDGAKKWDRYHPTEPKGGKKKR